MVTNLPTVGVLFDWTLVGESTYGRHCWAVFWRAIDPLRITASLLWEGDADCNDRYYCIAVQSADAAKLNYIKEAISQSAEFKKIAGYPTFIEGAACTREPLVDAGRIDAAGNWVGSGGNAGVMLDVVRKEREPIDAGEPARVPARSPSALTSALPKWGSFADLDRFCRKTPSFPRVGDQEFFWTTPEELCDIVESAIAIADVYYSTYSCPNSSDLCRVALCDKTRSSNWLSFTGLFPVPSIQHFVNEWDFPAEYQKMRPILAGIRGRFVMNFHRGSASGSLDSKDLIEPSSLWPRLYLRRAKFLEEIEGSEKRERQAAEEAKKREEERRKKEAADREARKVAEAKKSSEEQRRRHLQDVRKSQSLCIMCGAHLGILDRALRREKHKGCYKFTG